jgi:hypothetical protein
VGKDREIEGDLTRRQLAGADKARGFEHQCLLGSSATHSRGDSSGSDVDREERPGQGVSEISRHAIGAASGCWRSAKLTSLPLVHHSYRPAT